LSGYLKIRCRSGTGLYNTYTRNYFVLVEDKGLLNYWNNESDTHTPALGSIDMALVLGVESKRNTCSKLEIDLGEDVMKLKARDKAEAERWKIGLLQWQEYLLLHMGEFDFEV